jgi:cob(I)alamin adenosyltransferase
MPRITRVYTRTGDDGTTALTGGVRVGKDNLRVELYGTVDELSATIGAALATGLDGELTQVLAGVQNELFHLGAELSVPGGEAGSVSGPRLGAEHVEALETLMDRLSESLEPLQNFILPGGSPGAAALHVGRTVCRRAERLAVTLGRTEPVGEVALAYLNRLSDALFVAARYENVSKGVADVLWDSRR